MTETLQLFFALLSVVTLLGGGVVLGAALFPRSDVAQAVLVTVAPYARWAAFAVAATCMFGSLYFSEVAHYTPCNLCWYQRICMYSLAVVLLVGAIRRDRSVRYYGLPLALIGIAISTYHFVIETFPSLESSTVCSVSLPCSFVWFTELGFVTLPFMAFTGFLAVIALLLVPDPIEVSP